MTKILSISHFPLLGINCQIFHARRSNWSWISAAMRVHIHTRTCIAIDNANITRAPNNNMTVVCKFSTKDLFWRQHRYVVMDHSNLKCQHQKTKWMWRWRWSYTYIKLFAVNIDTNNTWSTSWFCTLCHLWSEIRINVCHMSTIARIGTYE